MHNYKQMEKHEWGGGGGVPDLPTGAVLAWVVHGEVDDASVLREGGAQAVLAEPGAVNVHRVALPHPSPLGVRIRP